MNKHDNRNISHPVWDVYDLYRSAKCYTLYYSIKLNRYIWTNSFVEIILAITTSSSVVGSLWLWNTAAGQHIWKYLLVVSAFLAVSKPIIRLTDKIRKYEEILIGYRALEHDLMKITIQINQSMKYEKIHRSKFLESIDRQGKLVQKSPEIKIDEKLLKVCQLRIEKELPVESFFVPKDN